MDAALEIRAMEQGDLPFADSLRALAGWNQTLADWHRLLRFGGEGCFIAHWNRAPAGVVTTSMHDESLAWIGMALVHPDFRRRGIGGALLKKAIEHLRARGVKRIKLDATPPGRSNYLRAGFRDEWSMTRWEGIAPGTISAASDEGIRSCQNGDLPAIKALDAATLGAARGEAIEAMLRDGRLALVHDSPEGVDGFALARRGSRAFYLGPLVARTSDMALKLASQVFTHLRGERIFWDIPDSQVSVRAWAAAQGFSAQRQLIRMVLDVGAETGTPVDGLFGIAGPEWG